MRKIYIEANIKEEATKINRWTYRKETQVVKQTISYVDKKGFVLKLWSFINSIILPLQK